jgi:hypothetical protein
MRCSDHIVPPYRFSASIPEIFHPFSPAAADPEEGTRMSRFAIFTTLPYQDRAIFNIDAIAVVTSKPGADGIRSAQLQMVDGSKIVITATFAELEQVLGATVNGSPKS